MDHLVEIVEPGDLVLTLGAGDIYRVGDELLEVLQGESSAKEEGTKK